MAKAGDPISQYYFRLDEVLYRSSAELTEDCTWMSLIERYASIWQEVPGTRETHDGEKKAVARAKKLTNVLEHTPLIYLAYWEPGSEDGDAAKIEEDTTKYNMRVNVSKESYMLYNVGDFVIEPKGNEFVVSRWTGVDLLPVGKPCFSMEAAVIITVIKAREEILEKKKVD